MSVVRVQNLTCLVLEYDASDYYLSLLASFSLFRQFYLMLFKIVEYEGFRV